MNKHSIFKKFTPMIFYYNGKQVNVGGTLAYVSQSSWIQSGTVQDNILFGKPMDKTRYEKAIKACALDMDINDFSHGDLTEIGQRGINMSGGQKQRIQLARAVYNDADIYLLDDPFSAVDAHTASILFNVSKYHFVVFRIHFSDSRTFKSVPQRTGSLLPLFQNKCRPIIFYPN
jgi:ABC-type nitrate/sulfonate/bicarbonate transport system ATPase subunit